MESFIKLLQDRGISHEIEDGKFSVGGSLDLEGCTGITALPDGLSVGGYLYLEGCTGITALPDGLSVGDEIYQ